MALIKCKECGKDVSNTLENCIHCGCPLSFGRVIFKASDTGIGILGKYFIEDEDGNTIAKLRPEEKFEKDLIKDEKFYIGRRAAFMQKAIEVVAHVNESNIFLIDMSSSGLKVVVSKIEE